MQVSNLLTEARTVLRAAEKVQGTKKWLAGKPWHYRYSIFLALFTLYLTSHLLHLYFSYQTFVMDAAQHGQPIPTFWSAQFWNHFLDATFENWQSEFLQLIAQAGAFAAGYWMGSSASREGDQTTLAIVRAQSDVLLLLMESISVLQSQLEATHPHPPRQPEPPI